MFGQIGDTFIRWEPYTAGDIICSRFPIEQWHKIVGDIHSDKEWEDFILKYTNSVKCWVLKINKSNSPIAFVYIFNEEGNWQKISIHGGGWENYLMYYRGFMLMIKHMLDHGLKVRTYCQLSNPRAIRFVRSVGFVPYRYSDENVFMWISDKKLKNSVLYKRLCK